MMWSFDKSEGDVFDDDDDDDGNNVILEEVMAFAFASPSVADRGPSPFAVVEAGKAEEPVFAVPCTSAVVVAAVAAAQAFGHCAVAAAAVAAVEQYASVESLTD